MTMNGAVLPVMALYVVAAENRASGLKNWPAPFRTTFSKSSWYATPISTRRNLQCALFPTFSHTHHSTCRSLTDFNSGYHMQEAGATADLELAYTLADGVEYARAGMAAGLDITIRAAPSFFWAIGMDFFMEIVKMRAARLLWHS